MAKNDKTIIRIDPFYPTEDKDINSIKDVINLFNKSRDSVNLIFPELKNICDRICMLILLFNRLDKLKAFI